jgi:hypothetical protein
MKRTNESTWKKIAESITSPEGTVSIPMTIADTSAFRLSTAGTWERAESLSIEANVEVSPRIILEHLSTIKHGVQMQIKGSLLPRVSGAQVTLQKLVAGKWITSGAGVATDLNSEFILSTIEAKRGVVKMRVRIVHGQQVISSSEFSIVVR